LTKYKIENMSKAIIIYALVANVKNLKCTYILGILKIVLKFLK